MGKFLHRALCALAVAVSWAIASTAAQAQIDCGNGYYCPAGSACLLGGWCAPTVAAAPGSTKRSDGGWCDPGFREHAYRPGSCSPLSYSDCTNGLICPPGTTCGPNNTCEGGPEPTGPMCGGNRCQAGRICSSAGNCMNPEYFQDCGNGTICSKGKACAEPDGCAIVGTQRTRQQPWRR